MKNNDKKNTSRKKMNANHRNSVGSTEPRTETGKIRNQANPQLPDKPRVVDRLQEKTDALKCIHCSAASITSPGMPLKIHRKNGMIEVDGDESSWIQTFGTSDPDLQERLVQQVSAALCPRSPDDLNYILASLRGIGPQDPVEGRLAAQMVAVSDAAMYFLAQATALGQPPEAVDANVNRASRLFRIVPAQMEAFNRHRGKVAQSMVVGNVNVADGGQAIVGPVNHQGPGKVSKDSEKEKAG